MNPPSRASGEPPRAPILPSVRLALRILALARRERPTPVSRRRSAASTAEPHAPAIPGPRTRSQWITRVSLILLHQIATQTGPCSGRTASSGRAPPRSSAPAVFRRRPRALLSLATGSISNGLSQTRPKSKRKLTGQRPQTFKRAPPFL